MGKFKFILGSIGSVLILVLIGYWAVASIETGGIHVDKQKQKELEEQNRELAKEVERLKNELRLLEPTPEEEVVETPQTPSEPDNTTPSTHQTLINELQKLIDEKVAMKEKSRGTRVGTVQTFLNIYNGTSKRVDNDYGKTTKADVAAFQKAVGLTADGEAGAATFQKMIDWLKEQ